MLKLKNANKQFEVGSFLQKMCERLRNSIQVPYQYLFLALALPREFWIGQRTLSDIAEFALST